MNKVHHSLSGRKANARSGEWFLQAHFLTLLEQQGISLPRPRGIVLCIFHSEKTPSLSIDTDRGVFHCFGCGVGGGVRDFARLVGEEWAAEKARTPAQRRERARMAIAARRREAEATALRILQRRNDEHEDALWAEWCDANTDATQAAELLAFFHRRPDQAEEFSEIVVRIEHDYADAVFRRSAVEFQASGEVWQ